MTDTPFRVIKGGLEDSPREEEEQKPYAFVSAWITDTRLMGVNAMRVIWKDRLGNDIHQFFYFDAVDTGFERFQEIAGSDEKELREAEISFAGGLGGKKFGLSEEEALFLIQDFLRVNKKTGEAPARIGIRLSRMLAEDIELSDEKRIALFQRICKTPLSANETVNYFMMRIADSDNAGIRYLSNGSLTAKDSPARGTLYTVYRNKIQWKDKNHAECESLLERDDGYEMWISEIGLSAGDGSSSERMSKYVSSYKRLSRMRISDTEAFMTMSHSEFVMVYESPGGHVELSLDSTPFTRRSSMVEENDGVSYMLFRPDNNHVDTRDYRLYDDIFGIYHLTSTGQFICSANSQHDMAMLELDLVFSPIHTDLKLKGNYEFNEPVMAQFLSSGYDDFNDFVAEITRGPEE
ncbi:MAG: hypothetical protein IKF54_04855 [Eubacterium sp.]|nr:hypothetical protein [Eubacterium sp.]